MSASSSTASQSDDSSPYDIQAEIDLIDSYQRQRDEAMLNILSKFSESLTDNNLIRMKDFHDLISPPSASVGTRKDARKRYLKELIMKNETTMIHPLFIELFYQVLDEDDPKFPEVDFVTLSEDKYDEPIAHMHLVTLYNAIVFFRTVLGFELKLYEFEAIFDYTPTISSWGVILRSVVDILLNASEIIFTQMVDASNDNMTQSVTSDVSNENDWYEVSSKPTFSEVTRNGTKSNYTKLSKSKKNASRSQSHHKRIENPSPSSSSLIDGIDHIFDMNLGNPIQFCENTPSIDLAHVVSKDIPNCDLPALMQRFVFSIKSIQTPSTIRWNCFGSGSSYRLVYDQSLRIYDVYHPFLRMLYDYDQKFKTIECNITAEGKMNFDKKYNITYPGEIMKKMLFLLADQLITSTMPDAIGTATIIQYNFDTRDKHAPFVPLRNNHRMTIYDIFIKTLFMDIWVELQPSPEVVELTNDTDVLLQSPLFESTNPFEHINSFQLKEAVGTHKCASCNAVVDNLVSRTTKGSEVYKTGQRIKFYSNTTFSGSHTFLAHFETPHYVTVKTAKSEIRYCLVELVFGCIGGIHIGFERITVRERALNLPDDKFRRIYVFTQFLKGGTMLLDNAYIGDAVTCVKPVRLGTPLCDFSTYLKAYNYQAFTTICTNIETPLKSKLSSIVQSTDDTSSHFNFILESRNIEMIYPLFSNYNKLKSYFDHVKDRYISSKNAISGSGSISGLRPFLSSSVWQKEFDSCKRNQHEGLCDCKLEEFRYSLRKRSKDDVLKDFAQIVKHIYVHGVGINHFRSGHFGFSNKNWCKTCHARTITATFKIMCCAAHHN